MPGRGWPRLIARNSGDSLYNRCTMLLKKTNCALVLSSVLFLALASSALAADVSRNWKGDLKMADGNALETSFVFKLDGEKLTGTATNMYGEEQITEGTVKGDDISFIVLAGGGQFKVIYYKGKIVGDNLKFTVTVGDFGDGELIAKRVS
jgi:hypothetical protein